jgi:hypothetical protein
VHQTETYTSETYIKQRQIYQTDIYIKQRYIHQTETYTSNRDIYIKQRHIHQSRATIYASLRYHQHVHVLNRISRYIKTTSLERSITYTNIKWCKLVMCACTQLWTWPPTGRLKHTCDIHCYFIIKNIYTIVWQQFGSNYVRLFYVLFVCKCALSPGDNPIADNKYISYRIVYHIVSYIISYHIIYHIISYIISSYHIISYRII